MVADGERGHAGADLDHRAGALVAADDRELGQAHHLGDLGVEDHVPGDEVLVGVAQARGGQLDLDLAGLGASSVMSSTLQSACCSHKMAAFIFMHGSHLSTRAPRPPPDGFTATPMPSVTVSRRRPRQHWWRR